MRHFNSDEKELLLKNLHESKARTRRGGRWARRPTLRAAEGRAAVLDRVNGALVNLSGTTSTGLINNNYCLTLDASAPLLFTATTGLGAFENYVSGAITLSGLLTPANA